MSTTLPSLQPLTVAIAQAESGGGVAGVAASANNPGNLFNGDVGYGTASNGETIYGSISDGWQALETKVNNILSGGSSVYSPNASIADTANMYVNGNNTTTQASQDWTNNVSNVLNTDPSTSISTANTNAGGAPIGSSSNIIQNTLNQISPLLGALGLIQGKANQSSGQSNTLSTSFIARAIVLIIGLLLIAAALFSFKTTQTVIQGTGKIIKTGVKIAAQ